MIIFAKVWPSDRVLDEQIQDPVFIFLEYQRRDGRSALWVLSRYLGYDRLSINLTKKNKMKYKENWSMGVRNYSIFLSK